MQDSLRLPGRPRGIQDKERVFAVEPLWSVRGRYFFGFLVPPDIPSSPHVYFFAGSLVDDTALDPFVFLECFIDALLEFDNLTASVSSIGGNYGSGARVFQTIYDGFSGEASEYHGVNSANPGAGQHGNRGFRNHGHIDQDPILRLDSIGLEDIGKAAHFLMELVVCENSLVSGFTFPDDSSLVFAAVSKVTVHAIFGNIETRSGEPLSEWRIPIEDFFPAFLPVELLGFAGPERGRLFDRFPIHPPILGHAGDSGLLR